MWPVILSLDKKTIRSTDKKSFSTWRKAAHPFHRRWYHMCHLKIFQMAFEIQLHCFCGFGGIWKEWGCQSFPFLSLVAARCDDAPCQILMSFTLTRSQSLVPTVCATLKFSCYSLNLKFKISILKFLGIRFNY